VSIVERRALKYGAVIQQLHPTVHDDFATILANVAQIA
jgi:hypothetical protein